MDSALAVLLESAVPFALRLRRPFRGLTVREGVLVRGPQGWGEFAPFDDYSDSDAARWLATAIEAAYVGPPPPRRRSVAVNAIIAATDPQDCVLQVREAVEVNGCSVVKIPVGSAELADDEARVASVRQVLDSLLGPGEGLIRIDAKGRWSAGEAMDALHILAAYGLEYVEQPCRTESELRAIRSRVDIPIAVDETIRLDAPDTANLRDLADIAILKPAPLGGPSATLALVEHLDMPVVISGSLDSSVGLAASLATAAAMSDIGLACGLGTGALLETDLIPQPVVPHRGTLEVRAIAPDDDCLQSAHAALAPERAPWWQERLIRAWGACDMSVRERVTT